MNGSDAAGEIARLKKERGAIILAHNYQPPEVQDVADFTGDSLELARKAAAIDAGTIVFCGVRFMAETAAILNPGRTVLVPDSSAGCPMADMINAADMRELRARHPGALFVCYVNSTAEVKAECDLCVTSGNAERVLAKVPASREVVFVPDRHLASHVAQRLGRSFVLWQGYCPTHQRVSPAAIERAKAEHPGSVVMAHPECPADVRAAADEVLATGAMCAFARSSPYARFIVCTESGLLHRLRAENPGKEFFPASGDLVCPNMKKTTLSKVLDSLRNGTERVEVPEETAVRARRAIAAMFEMDS